MTTYNLYSTVSESFTYPVTPDADTAQALITYEWGEVVQAATAATLDAGTTYTIELADDLVSAAGSYRIKWTCEVSAVERYFYTSFNVENQYVTEAEFMEEYPEFDEVEYQGAVFDRAERTARKIIDTFCGQSFQQVINRTMEIDGNGEKKLFVPMKISSINSVSFIVDSTSTDYSDYVEIDPQSRHWLRTTTSTVKFPSLGSVSIDGDWGWYNPPINIVEATKLLIVDLFDDTRRDHHRYGISRIWQDTNRLEFDSSVFASSTGNLDVDVLLMDYVFWVPAYV